MDRETISSWILTYTAEPFVCLITSTKKGIEITKLDDFVENLEGRIKPNTKAIYIEIPTNPMMNVTDIKAISKITRVRGFGAMVTFEVCSREFARCILKNVKLIQFAESLGGVETLITYPKSEI